MSAKPKAVERTLTATQKATAEHVNAIILALHDAALELISLDCKCATCQLIRKNAVHIKAIFSTSTKVKHIEAA